MFASTRSEKLQRNSREPDVRDQLQLRANVHGVVVTNVQPGSPADNAGISRGDVIAEVNRKSVQSVKDVQRELGSVAEGQDALLLIWSRGGSSFVVLHSEEAQANNQGE